MRAIVITALLSLIHSNTVFAERRYDYQSSDAYRALTPVEQKMLNQVHRDFVLLWGALDMYAEENDGQVPARLADLVPLYLKELPKDPFATKETAQQKDLASYTPSREGYGYRYWPGQGNAFVISSVGLPGFPYRSERGNVDLYIAKGIWTGGGQLHR